jgi:hypothetical protein
MTLRQTVVLFMSAALLLLPRQLTAVRSRAAEHALLEKAMQRVIEHRDTEEDWSILSPANPEIVNKIADRIRTMEDPPPSWRWQR